MRKVMDILRTSVLMTAAFGGMVVGVFHVVGHPLSWVNEIPSITLVLIGLIAIDLSLERFTSIRRIEKKLESIEGFKRLDYLPEELRESITNSIKSHVDLQYLKKIIQAYVNLQYLKDNSKKSNPHFCLLVDNILNDQLLLLNGLSHGILSVPEDQILAVHSKLANHYVRRLDAVSNQDIDFWSGKSSIAEKYFRRNEEAIKNGTVVTRIFIFSILDLVKRSDEIVSILERQHRIGIGWGVAIWEELEYEVSHTNLPLDFALFDRDKAISFFRKKETHEFEAIFLPRKGHENEARIRGQRELHKNLIIECWLANNIFKEKYAAALLPGELKEIKEKMLKLNETLKETLSPDVVEDDVFVLVASGLNDIKPKVEQLTRTVQQWRRTRFNNE